MDTLNSCTPPQSKFTNLPRQLCSISQKQFLGINLWYLTYFFLFFILCQERYSYVNSEFDVNKNQNLRNLTAPLKASVVNHFSNKSKGQQTAEDQRYTWNSPSHLRWGVASVGMQIK